MRFGWFLMSGGAAFAMTRALSTPAAPRAGPVVDPSSLSELQVAVALTHDRRIWALLIDTDRRVHGAAMAARGDCVDESGYDDAEVTIDVMVGPGAALSGVQVRQRSGRTLPAGYLSCMEAHLKRDLRSRGEPLEAPFRGDHQVLFRLSARECK
jgi:hypothetical protein